MRRILLICAMMIPSVMMAQDTTKNDPRAIRAVKEDSLEIALIQRQLGVCRAALIKRGVTPILAKPSTSVMSPAMQELVLVDQQLVTCQKQRLEVERPDSSSRPRSKRILPVKKDSL